MQRLSSVWPLADLAWLPNGLGTRQVAWWDLGCGAQSCVFRARSNKLLLAGTYRACCAWSVAQSLCVKGARWQQPSFLPFSGPFRPCACRCNISCNVSVSFLASGRR